MQVEKRNFIDKHKTGPLSKRSRLNMETKEEKLPLPLHGLFATLWEPTFPHNVKIQFQKEHQLKSLACLEFFHRAAVLWKKPPGSEGLRQPAVLTEKTPPHMEASFMELSCFCLLPQTVGFCSQLTSLKGDLIGDRG